MIDLHFIQMQIIKALSFKESARFAELNVSHLESHHFSYHIAKLQELKLVHKNEDSSYSLSIEGKKLAMKLDSETFTFKKEPKNIVLLIVRKKIDGKEHFLLLERMRTPFYKHVGFIGGEIEYDELTENTVLRELKEESGLIAKHAKFLFCIREHIYKDAIPINDMIFYVYECFETVGDEKNSIEGNLLWMTEKEVIKYKPTFYDVEDLLEFLKNPPPNRFVEKKYSIENY